MNRVFVMGNLTKDPETKQLQTGTVVGNLRMAISESFTTKSGEKKETVCYVDVVVWGRLAETCKQYLSKGAPVLVDGRLQYDTWEKDGQKRSMLKIRADNVQFLGGPSGKGRGGDEITAGESRGVAAMNRGEQPPEGLDKDEEEPPF
jgi:single-strand DNA-binding protein